MKLRSTLIMSLKDHIARTAAKPVGRRLSCLVLPSRVSLISCEARSNCLVSIPLVNMSGLPACMLKCASRMQPDQKPLPTAGYSILVLHG